MNDTPMKPTQADAERALGDAEFIEERCAKALEKVDAAMQAKPSPL